MNHCNIRVLGSLLKFISSGLAVQIIACPVVRISSLDTPLDLLGVLLDILGAVLDPLGVSLGLLVGDLVLLGLACWILFLVVFLDYRYIW